ncbi:MAG: ABC-F family ATP-binding cassette domain-containing protein [Alphaproteobacteria bacterium]
MLRIDQLTYRVGQRTLFDDATAVIPPGRRIGLVGRNGAGKTTLLRLIAGELAPDSGVISVPPRWQIGMTRQEAPGGSESLIDTVLAQDAELAALEQEAETATDPARIGEIHARLRDKGAYAARSRAARILAGLGFDANAQRGPCSALSGGWRMRVALAGLLFRAPDLLLLDEPTNHLDLEAALWLEDYLCRYDGTVVLVSHDRELLNRVAEAILHLEHGRLTLYQGNYDRFEDTYRLRLSQLEAERAKQDVQRAHIQAFVDRFRYKASKARQAQSRLKMLARLQPIPEPPGDAPVTFNFPEPEPLSPPLLVLDDIAVGYGGRPVLSRLALRIDDDDRIALLGANGNGKSTLMKLLAGRLAPLSGQIAKSGKLRIGYFAQHQADELDLAATPVIQMGRRMPRFSDEQVRSHLGRFGFSQTRAETRIGDLSGGEKARLLFALMSAEKPNILLLDEPTNHLDIASREALVQAINGFRGAVIIVSHDPHVVALTADRFWLVAGGRVEAFDGDIDDYRSHLAAAVSAAAGAQRSDSGSVDRRAERRQAALRRAALAPLRKQAATAAARVQTLSAEKARIEAALADPGLYQGESSRLIGLRKDLGQVSRSLGEAEDAWLVAEDALEQASAGSTSSADEPPS